MWIKNHYSEGNIIDNQWICERIKWIGFIRICPFGFSLICIAPKGFHVSNESTGRNALKLVLGHLNASTHLTWTSEIEMNKGNGNRPTTKRRSIHFYPFLSFVGMQSKKQLLKHVSCAMEIATFRSSTHTLKFLTILEANIYIYFCIEIAMSIFKHRAKVQGFSLTFLFAMWFILGWEMVDNGQRIETACSCT